jgi:hypothetical protein
LESKKGSYTMDAVTLLQQLGLTREELTDRVVQGIVSNVITVYSTDDEGNPYPRDAKFITKLQEYAQKDIDQKVIEIGDKHVLPKVGEMIDNLVLQKTNAWGEKVGKPVTFIEYMVERASDYMTEKVDSSGKTKEESGSYSFSGTQTRVAHMIHRHLHHNIEEAMKQALSVANSTLVKGLEETVKSKLAEILAVLKVTVKV